MEALQHEVEHEFNKNPNTQKSVEQLLPEEVTGCGVCCNPHRTCHRFLILAFICFSGFSE
jgi:hypothetical protein